MRLTMGRARRRIVRDFVAAGATTPVRAIAYATRDTHAFGRLVGFGAIVRDGTGRYHLDACQLGAFRSAVRLRHAGIVALTGLVAGITAALAVLVLTD